MASAPLAYGSRMSTARHLLVVRWLPASTAPAPLAQGGAGAEHDTGAPGSHRAAAHRAPLVPAGPGHRAGDTSLRATARYINAASPRLGSDAPRSGRPVSPNGSSFPAIQRYARKPATQASAPCQ